MILFTRYSNFHNYYRYPIDPKRSVFLFREGSQAVDAKNYLLEQPELSHVMLEGQTYYRDKKKNREDKKVNHAPNKSEL